jgi:hypothetical protein
MIQKGEKTVEYLKENSVLMLGRARSNGVELAFYRDKFYRMTGFS